MRTLKFWKPESGFIGGIIFGTVLAFCAVPIMWIFLKWFEYFFGGKP